MEAVATGLIAVLGTLLGSSVTYLFQRRAALRAERFTRGERLREERIDAYCAYGGALANYRRGQLDQWFARHEGRGGEEAQELRRETQRLRTAAMEAMFRAELLTDAADLEDLARKALKEIDRIPTARSREELKGARDVSRSAIYAFVAASRRHVPGLGGVPPRGVS
ncbi:hypothetical protein SAMN06297387_108197 [Streptomyces zhaozhouensis]|uniref:Uncharacterized protein n=1 Tax=Streptomyces zhaozhouensis TaxID=1300267 RepID=A0A286DWU9_9ACTN|nr:hypothetical protein [Streptomyces zhaozhouensis]SOD63034.1 hypothetical protein SAMN06297387_108197 [Streptomyces zhaozhouensis]